MINKFEILTSLCNDCNSLECEEHINTNTTKTEHCIQNPIVSVNETNESSDASNSILDLTILDNEDSESIFGTQVTDTRSLTNNEHTENTNIADTSPLRGLEYQRKGIHISNLNICHLKPKLDDVKLLLSSERNVDVFGICETFLNQTVEDKILNIEGYQFERKDRENCTTSDKTNGGGIIIYIAEHIKYIRRFDLESTDIESVWLEIYIPNSKSFLICSVYRPPSAKAEWIERFSNQIDESSSKCAEVYIMGDINIDIINGIILNNNWKQQIELHDFTQLVKEPTRVTAHSEKNNRSYLCVRFIQSFRSLCSKCCH